jgi:hypothetical protein
VEALKYARGYRDANGDDIEIHVLVHAESAVGLATACPWIDHAYAILPKQIARDGDAAACLAAVPRSWDYIISSYRFHDLAALGDATIDSMQQVFDEYFEVRLGKGFTPRFSRLDERDKRGPQILPYKLNAPIRIPVPATARTFVDQLPRARFRICIVPSGSIGTNSPSIRGWRTISSALIQAFPDAHLHFTGISKDWIDRVVWRLTRRPVRTRPIIGAFTRTGIARIRKGLPRIHDSFNIGFWNQLALLEASDLLIAPHTGFAFLAPCVGTPWLAISACRWHEYLFNDVPFASVLPDCGWYPAHEDTNEGCGRLLADAKRSRCADDERIERQISEIVSSAEQLRRVDFGFADALDAHLKKIEIANVRRERFFFFDGMGDWNEKLSQPVDVS